MTDGSRGTFSSGMSTIFAARDAINVLRERAAATWEIPVKNVEWKGGQAIAKGSKYRKLKAMTLDQLAAASPHTGGPIAGHSQLVADGAGVSFASHICDIEVDPETSATKVVRYTVIQDAGKAIYPSYVEGQMQGGSVQGIGWALNEEYLFDGEGQMLNPTMLDYRMPTALDVPMIDTVIIEVPNPSHPFGVRGVGEPPIVPPPPAIANAIKNATGLRMTELPMSPPRLFAALKGQENGGAQEQEL